MKQGRYALADGRSVEIVPLVDSCLAATRFYLPEQSEEVRQSVLATVSEGAEAIIEVRNESTLAGIFRLLAETNEPVAALNCASAKNPGGGFLNGSQAQEESLARSSALYASLLRAPDYYGRHRALRSCLYSDAMIVSPSCPIFRDDGGNLPEKPAAATFITSAAPNAGAIATNTPEEITVASRDVPAPLRACPGLGRRAWMSLAGPWCLGLWGVPQRSGDARRGICKPSRQGRTVVTPVSTDRFLGA